MKRKSKRPVKGSKKKRRPRKVTTVRKVTERTPKTINPGKKKRKKTKAKKPRKPKARRPAKRKAARRAKADGHVVFFNGHRYAVKLVKKGRLRAVREIRNGKLLPNEHPLHKGADGKLRTMNGTGVFVPKGEKVANPLLGVTLGLGNPRGKAKPKKGRKRRSSKGALERYFASKPTGHVCLWKNLPPSAKADPLARKAVRGAARADKISRDMVPFEKTPDDGVHLNVGDLMRVDYKVRGKSRRALRAPYGYTHAAGDHGKGRKKSRPCALAKNLETGQIGFVRRRGSRIHYDERGVSG